MSSFVLGIYMYDLYKNDMKKQKRCLLLFIGSFVLLILFKYNDFFYNGIICPFVLSLSFVYLFECTRRNLNENSTLVKCVCKIGKNSYSIYLLNTFVAWELGSYVSSLIDFPDTYVYMLWLPISICILYSLSIYYGILIKKVSKLIFK